MNARIAAIILVLFAGSTRAQESIKKENEPSVLFYVVNLTDGSRLVTTILQKDIRIATKYGELSVPLEEIKKIEFGFHCPPEREKEIIDCINNLGSDDFKKRENAQFRLVKIGHLAYPFIKKSFKNSNDLEIARRAEATAEKIQLRTSSNLLLLKNYDYLETKEFAIAGKIKGETLRVWSHHVGEITLGFHSICSIGERSNPDGQIIPINATLHSNQWLDSKIKINQGIRLVISTKGQVDLWPQGPGQYMTSPKGYNTAGKGSIFMAGALIGRIGEKGKVFLIGENCDEVSGEEGDLFLQIVQSPWDNSSSGIYYAHITTSYSTK